MKSKISEMRQQPNIKIFKDIKRSLHAVTKYQKKKRVMNRFKRYCQIFVVNMKDFKENRKIPNGH